MADFAPYGVEHEVRGAFGLTRSELWAVLVPLFFIFALLRLLAWVMPPPTRRRTLIVLGSGGHTAEMFRFLETIIDELPATITPRHYILAATDSGSEDKLRAFEDKVGATLGRGQSFFTSIFSTLWAFFWSFLLALYLRATLVLANGPGTCVPVIMAAWILKKLGVTHHCCIAYSESYACVTRSSLTTKIVADHCDLFFVQWLPLYRRYKSSIYSGRVPLETRPRVRSLSKAKPAKLSYVFVSVGTTQFQELIDEVARPGFIQLLKELGYSGIRIQYGRGARPTLPPSTEEFEIAAFDLKPSLDAEFDNASLVIAHAGVGTLFEALEKEKNVIAVPNARLMNNHQTEIASVLEKGGFIHVAKLGAVASKVRNADFTRMRVFPKTETSVWGNALLRTLKTPGLLQQLQRPNDRR